MPAAPIFSDNPAYREYAVLLARLHELDRRGLLDSDEADEVREQMDAPELLLSPAEQQRLAQLSADLYCLSDTPPNLEIPPEEARQAAGLVPAEFQLQHWEEVLRLLRKGGELFPKDRLAYVRGRCWAALGDWTAAFWFYDRAANLNGLNANYRFLALDALFKTGRNDEALSQSHALLNDAEKHPRIIYGAAKVVFDSAVQMPESWARKLYLELVGPLQWALDVEDRLPGEQMLPSVTITAWITLALSQEHLGRLEDARTAYDKAVARFPDSDELLTARASLLLRLNLTRLADRDLEVLIKRETRFVYPYLFAAHRALLAGDFATCVTLSDLGSQRTDKSDLLATFAEWSAISLCEMAAPEELVRIQFNVALECDPLNDRIRHNLEVFERQAGPSPGSLRKFEIPDTVSIAS